ncbi:putative phospholipid-transporting ATPase 5 [Forsythia ovata]|uniref:Phospholipid-transporting ATPase 5 n=1 Tax=Forsythia ovata TaxID=205694 RepID=A0ABD1S003_9LAMI
MEQTAILLHACGLTLLMLPLLNIFLDNRDFLGWFSAMNLTFTRANHISIQTIMYPQQTVLSVTPWAPFTPISLIAPLVFVVGISMLKEAVEDWHRFLQDRNVNSRKVKVHVGNGLFVQKFWDALCVGDVVKVSKNEYFPSDLLLLSSSYEDGVCYVETMNLDGETNLKAKRSLEATLGLDDDEELCRFKGTIRYTKAVRNSTRAPSKRSKVERKMDHVIYMLFAMMVLISSISATGSALYTESEKDKRVMALCHTGIPVEDDKSDRLKYEAESPEEVAFLIAAHEFGFKFCERTQSIMVLQELDPSSGLVVKREYKLLNLLEFNSSRKRMSVIVSNEDGEIFLFCKGADEVIFERLADNGRTYQQATTMHLSNYAEDGLRTMVLAYKRIGLSEYEHWNSMFIKAKSMISSEREELLENAS